MEANMVTPGGDNCMKAVDADAIRKARGTVVGQLGKLRRVGNPPTAAFATDSGGSQPPRRLPACPTSRRDATFVSCPKRVPPPCNPTPSKRAKSLWRYN
jgi:hypothetical protein